MKKSNALMLSYMIFLAIALLASIIFKWNGLDRIAMAATIAGCFFAFADLFNWKATFNNYSCDKLEIAHKTLVDTYIAELEFTKEHDKELEHILEKVKPYRDRDSRFVKIIDFTTEALQKNDVQKAEYTQSINEFDEMYKDFEKERKKSKKFETGELVLMILGFVLFFSIIVFDYFVFVLTNYQAIATIVAFIAIMYNYYAKDIIEENAKIVFDGIIKKAEANKLELKNLNESLKEINLTKTVDELIDTIEKIEDCNQALEEPNNG